MPDRLTPGQRSRLMARVRSKDTGIEIAVRRALHAVGLRFRKHARWLPGTPDIVFSSSKGYGVRRRRFLAWLAVPQVASQTPTALGSEDRRKPAARPPQLWPAPSSGMVGAAGVGARRALGPGGGGRPDRERRTRQIDAGRLGDHRSQAQAGMSSSSRVGIDVGCRPRSRDRLPERRPVASRSAEACALTNGGGIALPTSSAAAYLPRFSDRR